MDRRKVLLIVAALIAALGTAVPGSGRPTVPTFWASGRLAVSAAVVSVSP